MKNGFFTIAACSILTLVGCTKSSEEQTIVDNQPVKVNNLNVMLFFSSGTSYSLDTTGAFYKYDNRGDNATIIQIVGRTPNKTSLEIVLTNILSPGQYGFGDYEGRPAGTNAEIVYNAVGNRYGVKYGLPGYLFIESVDANYIKGSLEVTLYDLSNQWFEGEEPTTLTIKGTFNGRLENSP